MSIPEVAQIARELIVTAILLSLPTLLVSLVVGLAVSVFQAVTSIQEQTLSFAPRILAVGLVLILTLPWSLQILTRFTTTMLWRLSEVAS